MAPAMPMPISLAGGGGGLMIKGSKMPQPTVVKITMNRVVVIAICCPRSCKYGLVNNMNMAGRWKGHC